VWSINTEPNCPSFDLDNRHHDPIADDDFLT